MNNLALPPMQAPPTPGASLPPRLPCFPPSLPPPALTDPSPTYTNLCVVQVVGGVHCRVYRHPVEAQAVEVVAQQGAL